MNRREPLKRFKVYWFTGDYWSADGEKQHCYVVLATSELEAEYNFRRYYPDCSLGWVEEIKEDAHG